MTLLHNQIIFKPFAPSDMTQGGLFVPDSCKEISNRGVIVKAARGTEKKPMKLKEGIVVHRVKSWGEQVFYDNELCFLMDEKAIIAIEE